MMEMTITTIYSCLRVLSRYQWVELDVFGSVG